MENQVKSYKSENLTEEQVNSLLAGDENFILDGVFFDQKANKILHEMLKAYKK